MHEMNFLDPTFENFAVNAGSVIVACNNVPLGVTDSTRQGARIKNMILRIKQIFQLTINPVFNGNNVRCIVFWDTQPNAGSTPTAAQVLQSSVLQSCQNVNWDNRYRFIFIHDEIIDMPVQAVPLAAGSVNSWSNFFDVDLGGVITTFNQSTSNINTNALYILLVSFASCSVFRQMRLEYTEADC